jgi:hypothetical protein
LIQIILAYKEIKFVQIKGQVHFKGEIIAKIGCGHLKRFSQEPQSQKSSDFAQNLPDILHIEIY